MRGATWARPKKGGKKGINIKIFGPFFLGFSPEIDPGVLLKDPGVLLKDPGVLLKDPGVLLKGPRGPGPRPQNHVLKTQVRPES